MANVGRVYNFISHQQATSTSTSDVKTITVSEDTAALMITARTNTAYVSFDGSDPSSSAHAIDIPAGAPPILFPFPPYPVLNVSVVKFASSAAGNSVLSVISLL